MLTQDGTIPKLVLTVMAPLVLIIIIFHLPQASYTHRADTLASAGGPVLAGTIHRHYNTRVASTLFITRS